MPVTDNDGVRLHWDEEGEGPPVLLVMGHRFSSAMWYPVIPALARRHRVIWFDNRGTGQSDAPRTATFNDHVLDAVAVLDAAGVARADAYGVSMGGGVVLELAMTRPDRVRSMVLGATCIFSSDKPRPMSWRHGSVGGSRSRDGLPFRNQLGLVPLEQGCSSAQQEQNEMDPYLVEQACSVQLPWTAWVIR
jgi:pimeloyl-ACP methyl ester carboxylesterase